MTSIDLILESDETGDLFHKHILLDYENLSSEITDLSHDMETRMEAMNAYYIRKGDEAIDTLNTLAAIYQMSGSKLVEHFLYKLSHNENISPFLKIESAKILISYDNNEKGYDALNAACEKINTLNISTPTRVGAIMLLMESTKYREECALYLVDFANDTDIDIKFRYKTLLSIERIHADKLIKYMNALFGDKEVVKSIYTTYTKHIQSLFGKKSLDVNDKIMYSNFLHYIPYETLNDIYTEYSDNVLDKYLQCMYKAFMHIITNPVNDIYYKIIASQYLLQNYDTNETNRSVVYTHLLDFARNDTIDYNRRADATDILLQFGDEKIKKEAKRLMHTLGFDGMLKQRTLFNNAQNVHDTSIDDSVKHIIDKLIDVPLYMIDNKYITFNDISCHIELYIKQCKDTLRLTHAHECKYCKNSMGVSFCSDICEDLYDRDARVIFALNRILIDRCLYSSYNLTLEKIFIKIYSYIMNHEHTNELMKRMIEELDDMSDTCSSGFVSRTVNIISGYDDFNINISWQDQIVSNFIGRMNASIRNINNDDLFRTKYIDEIVSIYLQDPVHSHIRDSIISDIKPTDKSEIIDVYLKTNKEKKINTCMSYFSEHVLYEVTIASSEYTSRPSFSLFYQIYVQLIRQVLYDEFIEFVTDDYFDNAFKLAILTYENE